MDCQAVWWRLFHCPCSSEWRNCLSLVELLFSLPASNGKLERTFSQLKIIKTEKRSLLNNQQLDDLLRLNTDVIPLASFDANPSIDLWWQEKKRRINQHPRKAYKKRKKTTNTSKPCSSAAIESVINVTVSAKTRLVHTSMHIENLKIICKIMHATKKNMQVLIGPVFEEGILKSIQTIYHLIRLLMENLKLFVSFL